MKHVTPKNLSLTEIVPSCAYSVFVQSAPFLNRDLSVERCTELRQKLEWSTAQLL